MKFDAAGLKVTLLIQANQCVEACDDSFEEVDGSCQPICDEYFSLPTTAITGGYDFVKTIATPAGCFKCNDHLYEEDYDCE